MAQIAPHSPVTAALIFMRRVDLAAVFLRRNDIAAGRFRAQ
jgi:hypothetical protein